MASRIKRRTQGRKADLGPAETEGPKARAAERKMPKRKVASFKNSPTFDRIYGNPQKPPRKTVRKKVFVKE